MLALENSGRNRAAAFRDWWQAGRGAGYELADLRLEADLLLSERDLSAKNADVKERAESARGIGRPIPRHAGRGEEPHDGRADRSETKCG